MKKPVIGITPAHNTENDDISFRPTYVNAILHAGGLPLPLPLHGSHEDRVQLLSLCDGLLLSGGPDPHPFLFGEDTQLHCQNVSPLRDEMELDLLDLALKARMPILGICRGIQIINVGLGGTLYQDIPSQVSSGFPIAHKQPFHYHIPSHHVRITEGTRLSQIAGDSRLQVNSMHHQAVRDPAPGLMVSAVADDGLIEALEKPDYPFLLGVQWHPEYLWEKDPAAARLFLAFTESCR